MLAGSGRGREQTGEERGREEKGRQGNQEGQEQQEGETRQPLRDGGGNPEDFPAWSASLEAQLSALPRALGTAFSSFCLVAGPAHSG